MPGKRRGAGDLRWLVTIRKPNATDDAANYPVPDWTTDAGVIARDVPAEWIAVSGGERVRGVQVVATANVVVMLRYQERLDPSYTPAVMDYRIYRQSTSEFIEIVFAADPYGTRQWLAVQGVRKVL